MVVDSSERLPGYGKQNDIHILKRNTDIEQKNTDRLILEENLTIKDITKNITFTARKKQKALTTRFTFDRFQWNIAYEGSWADKTLVDIDIELTINLITDLTLPPTAPEKT